MNGCYIHAVRWDNLNEDRFLVGLPPQQKTDKGDSGHDDQRQTQTSSAGIVSKGSRPGLITGVSAEKESRARSSQLPPKSAPQNSDHRNIFSWE